MADIGNAAERIAPGPPGSSIKFAFIATSSTLQSLVAMAGQNAAKYISMKTTAAVHICFGDSLSLAGAVTDADFILEPGDGWQDVLILPGTTSFKVKGDGASTGSLYLWPSGH